MILPGIMNESIDSISQLISEEDDSKTKGSRGSKQKEVENQTSPLKKPKSLKNLYLNMKTSSKHS